MKTAWCRPIWSGFEADKTGNVAITAALCLPLILYSLALGVDYGMITLQQRRLQQLSDIGAIVAASDIDNAAANLATNFQKNGILVAVKTAGGYTTPDGSLPLDSSKIGQFQAVAEYTPGTYVADPTIPAGQRFAAGVKPYDAVKVAMTQKAEFAFASAFASPPTLHATGTASASKVAAFSIGSRLASMNGGVLNALLGSLLGTTVSLKVADYEALLSTDVDLLSFLDLLATDLNLTAANYDKVLSTSITYPQLLKTLGKTPGLSAAASRTIAALEKTLSTTQLKVKLEDLVNLGQTGERLVGTGSHLLVQASALDIISTTALAANQKKQVAVNVAAGVPGLTNVTLNLAIGERPQGVTSNALGTTGAAVRTAQLRLQIEATVSGLAAITGIKVRIPLYVEAAYGEAKLQTFSCLGGNPRNASLGVDVVPGVAEIALGDVDPTAMANFGSKPRVTRATIIDATLLKVSAMADTTATNSTKQRLTFQQADIAAKTIKNVSTRDTLTTTVQSLLKKTDIRLQLLFITLGTDATVLGAIADTLSAATAPLDELLYNTLLLLGIKIGEADVRFTDARCQQSVLVQ